MSAPISDQLKLLLPVRPPVAADADLPAFADPECGPGLGREQLKEPDIHWRVVHDIGADRVEMQVGDGAGTFRILGNDLTMHNQGYETYSVSGNDLATVTGETTWEHAMSRHDWRVRTLTRTRLTAEPQCYRIEAKLQAWEGEDLAHEALWEERIARNMA